MFNSSIGVLALCVSFTPQSASGATAGMGSPPSLPAAAIRSRDNGFCGQVAARRYVGTVADTSVHNAIAKATGHSSIRWISPGEAITQDYRADRLNVITDESGRILTVRCG